MTVDPKKCPTLARMLARSRAAEEQTWGKVVELRHAGKGDAADRLVKKLLGVQGPPMSEETKKKLKAYNEEHKEEIQRRRKIQTAIRKAASRPRGGRR